MRIPVQKVSELLTSDQLSQEAVPTDVRSPTAPAKLIARSPKLRHTPNCLNGSNDNFNAVPN